MLGLPDSSWALRKANNFTSLLSRSASAELRSVSEMCSAVSLSDLAGRHALVEQRAMHHQVGVAADGRGEVGVFFLGQAVVAQRLDRVTRPHERFEKTDLSAGPMAGCRGCCKQLLHFHRPAEIAAGDVMAQHFLAIFPQAPFIRALMHAVNRREGSAISRAATASLASSMYSSINWWETSFSTLSMRTMRPAHRAGFCFRENPDRANRP